VDERRGSKATGRVNQLNFRVGGVWPSPGALRRGLVRPALLRQQLHGGEEVRPLVRLWKAAVGQSPDPNGAVADHQRAGGLAQSTPQGFGVQLLAQSLNARARGPEAALNR
jgi:hypothetical protein